MASGGKTSEIAKLRKELEVMCILREVMAALRDGLRVLILRRMRGK